MKKYFVTFYSPGSFVSESSTKELDINWENKNHKQKAIDKAVSMSKSITERYGAIPYGFRFSTRSRKANELDSKVTKSSNMYYLPHCKVETKEEIIQRNLPEEETLRWNMDINEYDRIVTTTKGWKATYPLEKNDVVLS
jgi:hypothetical protein